MADLLLDPTIVEEQVRRLNRQADSLGFLGVVVGLVPGAAVGALPLLLHTPIPSKFGFATLLLGALAGGALGYMFGSSRSFGYRLRGQLMLGQLRLEQNVEALLAVSERPASVPALPAPEPMHALPEPPSIEEIIQAGLAMPSAPPLVEAAPAAEPEPAPVEHEEVAPLPAAAPPVAPVMPGAVAPEPEPEPETEHEPLLPPAPSWAAALEQVLAPLAPEPVATPEPVPAPQPVAMPEPIAFPEPIALPEPVAVPAPEPIAFPEPVAVPAPEPIVAHEPGPVPVWSVPDPVGEPPAPLTTPAWSFAPPSEPAHEPEVEEEHAPAPQPLRPDFGSTVPAWAAPAPAPAPAPETQPEPVPPAAHVDLSALSIAEIARLADAGSL